LLHVGGVVPRLDVEDDVGLATSRWFVRLLLLLSLSSTLFPLLLGILIVIVVSKEIDLVVVLGSLGRSSRGCSLGSGASRKTTAL
jgi:hypothetical protein